MDYLASIEPLSAFENALKSMPKTPEETYSTLLSRIQSFEEERESLAYTCLAWLLISEEDLNVTQLQHAIGIRKESDVFDIKRLPAANNIVKACEGLVEFCDSDRRIAFLHVTARKYVADRFKNCFGIEPKLLVTEGCINYLSLGTFGQGRCQTDEEFESRLREFPLYRYVARHWVHHIRNTHGSDLTEKALRFLMVPAKVDSASQAMLAMEEPQSRGFFSQLMPKRITGLHLAAHLDLQSVLEPLLTRGQKVTSMDSKNRTPLWYAVRNDSIRAAKYLSETDRITFAMMLEKKEHELSMSLLNIAGNAIRDLRGRTALHIGAMNDDLDVMKLALQFNSEIDPTDYDENTPLVLALQETKMSAITWLLQKGASTIQLTATDILDAYEATSEITKPCVLKLSEDKGSKSKTLNIIGHARFVRPMRSDDSDLACLLYVITCFRSPYRPLPLTNPTVSSMMNRGGR